MNVPHRVAGCRVLVGLLVVFLVMGGPLPRSGAGEVPKIGTAPHPPDDAQSTTGPTPPSGVEIAGSVAVSKTAVVIGGVPAYIWRYGCGPTAAGMVVGYWDTHGYDWLIPGNASSQTVAVNEAIASSQGAANHYDDYALPIDIPPDLVPDLSEPPAGDEHSDNRIADFMRTSQSARSNYYGWSWFSDVTPAFTGYFQTVTPAGYHLLNRSLRMSNGSLNWDEFRAEIDARHPVVLLVDTDGNGSTDHFITAIGYDPAGQLYAALNTWDTSVHWFPFAAMGGGRTWSIYGAVTFAIVGPYTVHLPLAMKRSVLSRLTY